MASSNGITSTYYAGFSTYSGSNDAYWLLVSLENTNSL